MEKITIRCPFNPTNTNVKKFDDTHKKEITEDYDLITVLRIDVIECKNRPSNMLKPYITDKIIKKAWVPHTIADQIHVYYKFNTVEDRINWENSLPVEIQKWIDRSLVDTIEYWGWETYQP